MVLFAYVRMEKVNHHFVMMEKYVDLSSKKSVGQMRYALLTIFIPNVFANLAIAHFLIVSLLLAQLKVIVKMINSAKEGDANAKLMRSSRNVKQNVISVTVALAQRVKVVEYKLIEEPVSSKEFVNRNQAVQEIVIA